MPAFLKLTRMKRLLTQVAKNSLKSCTSRNVFRYLNDVDEMTTLDEDAATKMPLTKSILEDSEVSLVQDFRVRSTSTVSDFGVEVVGEKLIEEEKAETGNVRNHLSIIIQYMYMYYFSCFIV